MPNFNSVLTVLSAIVLLGISSLFGFMSMPTEMGFAILAGALGMAFSNIDKISEFSGAGFSAKMKDQFQAVINKETEPDIDQESKELPQEVDRLKEKDEHAEKALLALTKSKYTWRSIGGIKTVTSQRPSDALNTLELLQREGLAKEGRSSSGSRIWTPTVRGSIIGAMIELHSTKSDT
ncbi:hypothetical protein [Amphritea sp. HPY]|uniref:hypothetical protein n=1 Tax=Amphritea sp. HPY TaxID=3421652 RepID=UPI003D7E1702